MKTLPKVSIIIFPGSNCDRDLKIALKKNLNINPSMVWHQEGEIKKTNMILIPGGFSFGDYLRAGILATKSPAIKEVIRCSNLGIPVVGICNGFQILTECRLLPGILLKNEIPNFLCKDVFLKINKRNNFFKNNTNVDIFRLPIAHSQGNFYAEKNELNSILENEQIIFQYSSSSGRISNINNPNGSLLNIAGITNQEKNILGMMPHPERGGIDMKGSSGQIFFELLKSLL